MSELTDLVDPLGVQRASRARAWAERLSTGEPIVQARRVLRATSSSRWALLVPCPTCGSVMTERCKAFVDRSKTTRPHAARLRAAEVHIAAADVPLGVPPPPAIPSCPELPAPIQGDPAPLVTLAQQATARVPRATRRKRLRCPEECGRLVEWGLTRCRPCNRVLNTLLVGVNDARVDAALRMLLRGELVEATDVPPLYAYLVSQLSPRPTWVYEEPSQAAARRYLRRLVGTSARLSELDAGAHDSQWRIWVMKGFGARGDGSVEGGGR